MLNQLFIGGAAVARQTNSAFKKGNDKNDQNHRQKQPDPNSVAGKKE